MADLLLPPVSVAGADLPVRDVLPEVVRVLAEEGTAVLVAPPGSGKTSLLPLALADAVTGTVVVAQPRRLATRAAAARLASLLGERPGGRVGYAMRGERRPGSRVEVVTTGLLLRRLQHDPELPGVGALVLDEVHERHLDADLALAFAVDVRATLRPDLAVVATSATPDTDRLARLLGAGVVTATTPTHPLEQVWAPPPRPLPLLPGGRVDPRLLEHVAATVRRALAEAAGDVLVFLPGEAEIHGVARRLGGSGVVVRPLYGRLPAAEQDLALTPGAQRRVVLATAVAESSLTVPGVRVVVDAGLARAPRVDHRRGLAALVTTTVSRASATQRAGRAAREGPGRVYRCWTEAEHGHLDAHTPPEIAVSDLAGFALTVAAWGGDDLALLDPPPAGALAAASELLTGLGAVAQGRVTARGRTMAATGVHPRLARALVDGPSLVGERATREVVALLSEDGGREDDLVARLRALRRGDDRAATARWRQEVARLSPSGDRRSSRAGREAPSGTGPDAGPGAGPGTDVGADLGVGTVVALAYPDRLARLRRTEGTEYLMAGGTGAALAAGSGLRGQTWLAVAAADRPVGRSDARIRSAAPVDEATALSVVPARSGEEVTWVDGGLVARRTEHLGAILLRERPLTAPDPSLVAAAVAAGLRRDGLQVLAWTPAARRLRERLAFCRAHLGDPWPDVQDEALLERLESWLDVGRVRRRVDLQRLDVTSGLRTLLPWPAAARLDELAPERLGVPTGRTASVDYADPAAPVLALRVQEAFGWTASPRLADGAVAVVLHLLSPAGRPVAVTADLVSFWAQGYPQVRSELRGRYPRHPWPEDPLAAAPTRRAAPRR